MDHMRISGCESLRTTDDGRTTDGRTDGQTDGRRTVRYEPLAQVS